jgi:hypothetical protein
MVFVAIATCLAAYLLARAIAGPLAGLIAAALLTVAPPFPLFAHRVLADLPPLGIALVACWLAWEARERRSPGLAAAAGAVLALAVATKPNAVLAGVPFLLLLLWERSGRLRLLLASISGGAAVGAVLTVVYRDVLGELWESVVVYHRDARDTPDVIDKWHELATFLDWRTPFAWLVGAGIVASVLLARRRQTSAVWALWAWAAISLAFLAYHHPLHYNHLLVLPVVLAVPAGIALGAYLTHSSWQTLGVGALALLLAAGYVQQQRRVGHDDVPEEPELVAAARLLEQETEPDELVVSDHSIVPFLADRRVAGPLVDTAVLRFETGSLTDAEVMRDLERFGVVAVVAGRAFKTRPELLRRLEARYGPPRRVDPDLVVFLE